MKFVRKASRKYIRYFQQFLNLIIDVIFLTVRRLLLVGEVWGSNPERIKSPTRCQRLTTAATLIVWALAQSRGVRHCSLVIPERVLNEYNKHLIFLNIEIELINLIQFLPGFDLAKEAKRKISRIFFCPSPLSKK